VRRIAWAGDNILFEAEPGNWRHWFSLSTTKANAQPVDLTPGEGFVEYVDVSPDGRWLYYAANIGDMERRHVWRVRTSGGKAEQLTKGDGIETMPVVPGGTHIAAMTAAGRLMMSHT
jgi:Tol biopolymer transport system component